MLLRMRMRIFQQNQRSGAESIEMDARIKSIVVSDVYSCWFAWLFGNEIGYNDTLLSTEATVGVCKLCFFIANLLVFGG